MICALETALNWIVDKINSLDITNPFDGETIWSPNVPRFTFSRVPKLAKGGIIDKPTIAMMGEAGKEAVVPLENNTEWLDKVASKVATMMMAIQENDNREITVNCNLEVDGKTLARATLKSLNDEIVRRGYKSIFAT